MRLARDEKTYQKAILAGGTRLLYEEPAIIGFKNWKIVGNRFPHTKIAEKNDMLVLKRELDDITRLNPEEAVELIHLLEGLREAYDAVLYNFDSMRSVHNVPHFHLYRFKESYK